MRLEITVSGFANTHLTSRKNETEIISDFLVMPLCLELLLMTFIFSVFLKIKQILKQGKC